MKVTIGRAHNGFWVSMEHGKRSKVFLFTDKELGEDGDRARLYAEVDRWIDWTELSDKKKEEKTDE